MSAQITVLVSGRVQGVGFRDWVRRQARSRELTGSARNLDDGRVEVVAVGPRAACESLLDALGGRTPGSVTDLDTAWSEADDATVGFRVG